MSFNSMPSSERGREEFSVGDLVEVDRYNPERLFGAKVPGDVELQQTELYVIDEVREDRNGRPLIYGRLKGVKGAPQDLSSLNLKKVTLH